MAFIDRMRGDRQSAGLFGIVWLTMATHDEQILQAARELIARHGPNAVVAASDWVDSVSRQGDRPNVDVAYRVLSAVERLVGIQG